MKVEKQSTKLIRSLCDSSVFETIMRRTGIVLMRIVVKIIDTQRWTRGNTKIGLVLEVMANYHQGELGIEIRIDSLSGEQFQSWIRFSNGLDNFVRHVTEATRSLGDEENRSARTGQLVIQESRIVRYSQIETDTPKAKAKLLQHLFRQNLRSRFRLIKGNELILSRLRSIFPKMLRVFLFRKEWFHCSGMELFLKKKTEQLNSWGRKRISNPFSQILFIGHLERG